MRDITLNKHGGNTESNTAWNKAARQAVQMRDLILRIIRNLERRGAVPEGVTPKEIAEFLHKPLHTISGRFTDLKEANLIRATEFVRDGSRAVESVR